MMTPSWGEMGKDLDVYGTFHAREVEPIICYTLIHVFTTAFSGQKWVTGNRNGQETQECQNFLCLIDIF